MNSGILKDVGCERKGSVGLETAIALPVLFFLLMAAVDLCQVTISQSLFQSAAVAEINVIRSYSASDIQNVTAAQIQSSLRRRLDANSNIWVDTDTVNVWFDDGAELLGQAVYFKHHITSYSPFREILIWRQSYEKPLVLYFQQGQ